MAKELYENLLLESYRYMDIGGSNPKTFLRTIYSALYNILYLPQLISLFALAIFEIATNYEGIDSISDFSETILVAFQGVVCWVTTILYRDKFVRVLQNLEHFWDIDACGENTKGKLNKVVTYTIRTIKGFKLMTLFGLTLILIRPLLSAGSRKELPAYSWKPNNYTFAHYILFYCSHIFTFFTFYFQVVGFNVAFVAIMTMLNAQFDLLKASFQEMDMKANPSNSEIKLYHEQLKKCIQHHSFIIRFSDDVEKVFSLFLFCQAGNTLIYTSIALLVSFVLSPDLLTFYRSSINLLNVLQQLAIGCFYGQLLNNKSKGVADGIYQSGWHLHADKHIRGCVLMISRLSQKAKTLTAFGLFFINFNTMLQVYKFAWSIFTLLRILKTKGAND